MVFATKVDAEGRWITIGTDGDRKVRLKVRTLTPQEVEATRREAFGRLKGRQLGKELAFRLLERTEAETVERAIREVLDSENFTIGIVKGDEALYSKALGKPVQAGEDVLLDGHWTDEVKRDVFENIDGLAARVDNKVAKLVLAEAEEEDEDREDF
jgi:hypothetical protein